MLLKVLAATAAVAAPVTAHAFPIAVAAGAGAGALGAFALPVLAAAGVGYWLRRKGARFAVTAAMTAALAVGGVVIAANDFGQQAAERVALFTNADTSYLNSTSPFPFTEPAQQAASKQAVTPQELVEGLQQGHFKALRLSTTKPLFPNPHQLTAEGIWSDKAQLLGKVEELGGRVVLVDDFGGIAGTVAEAALTNFDLNIGFLQGGSSAMVGAGWDLLDAGITPKGTVIEAAAYKDWLAENPDAYVLSITTDDEFVQDGWLFGDKTISLTDFFALYPDLINELATVPKVFLASFESNASGATPILVNMLTDAGLDVTYVMPDEDEVLVKPSYFDSYKTADRVVTISDAKRYIRYHPSVVFLDFSEQPWSLSETLGARYVHFPMSEVAKGGLNEFIKGLDISKSYVGLTFDRRTAYHSILAGEQVSKLGGNWLGRFTQAGVFSDRFLEVDELNPAAEQLMHFLLAGASGFGMKLIGFGYGSFLLGMMSGLLLIPLFSDRYGIPASSGAFLASIMLLFAAHRAFYDHPNMAAAYLAYFFGFGMTFGLLSRIYSNIRKNPIKSLSGNVDAPKAALLNDAAALGFTVAKGYLVKGEDLNHLKRIKLGSTRYIVRSAALTESADHATTAGVYQSHIGSSKQDVAHLVGKVMNQFQEAGVEGAVLVQEYVEAALYGVIQYESNARTGQLSCSVGPADAVTSGKAVESTLRSAIDESNSASAASDLAGRALLALSELGAYNIEFAVTESGELVILQLNVDLNRVEGFKRLKALSTKRVIEVESRHPDALSAAVVAALAPGHIHAFGNRRFCEVMEREQLLEVIEDDLETLGLNTRIERIPAMHDWVTDYMAGITSSEPEATVEAVVAAIRRVSSSLGVMNRAATAMLNMDGKGTSNCRLMLLSSIAGANRTEGLPATSGGLLVSPMVGYSAATDGEYAKNELPDDIVYTHSMLVWVKDATSFLISIELGLIAPAIKSICEQGKAQELLWALESSAGDWDALLALPIDKAKVTSPTLFKDIAQASAQSLECWRIPASGIAGKIIFPDDGVDSGVLLLESCSMDHLPELERAIAVIAREGSITSHLMQHAAAMCLPVVISNELPDGLGQGDTVSITCSGEVFRA